MGHQECFVLPQSDQSAIELINLMRNRLDSSNDIECIGISTFSCPLNCTVYPKSDARTIREGKQLVLSLGNRKEQVDLFKELGLEWMYLDEICGPEEIRGEDLFKKYEHYSEVSEG